MSDKKKKELKPEDLKQAAGGVSRGELNEADPRRQGGSSTSGRNLGGGTEAEGELSPEGMRGIAGGTGLGSGQQVDPQTRGGSGGSNASGTNLGGGTEAEGELTPDAMRGLAGGAGQVSGEPIQDRSSQPTAHLPRVAGGEEAEGEQREPLPPV
jgi:hypothetical protein